MSSDSIEILLVEDNLNEKLLALHAFARQINANYVAGIRVRAEALTFIFCTGAYTRRAIAKAKMILLDLRLPLVDGMEKLRQIRADPHIVTIPVVILTSSAEERDIVVGYHQGINSYIVKPVDFEQFNEVAKVHGFYRLLLNRQPSPAKILSVESASFVGNV